jgi:hypothetical protein
MKKRKLIAKFKAWTIKGDDGLPEHVSSDLVMTRKEARDMARQVREADAYFGTDSGIKVVKVVHVTVEVYEEKP